MEITDIKEYHKNPRKISADRFQHLKSSLAKLGDLGGIVVNRPTQEAIGGNQRTKSFLGERTKFKIQIVQEFTEPKADGTIAYGYVVRDEGQPTEQKFSYREVIWTPEQCEEANIVANKVTGMWDFDKLGNEFDMDKLMDYGFSATDLELIPKDELHGMDNDGLAKSLDSYMEGNIRQISISFLAEDFDAIIRMLDRAMAFYGVKSHSELVERWLKKEFPDPQNESPKIEEAGA